MITDFGAEHMTWQEQEIQELRRLYTDSRRQGTKLKEENKKLKEEVERLKEQLLKANRR